MNKRDLLLAVFVMAIWGLNFSVIKLGVSAADPLQLSALRFSLATIPALFFVKKPNVKWRFLIAYGLIFGVGVWGMATCSIDAGLSAGMASLLLQMNVIIGFFLGCFFLKESINKAKLAGCALAVTGLFVSLAVTDGSVTFAGFSLILIAALCWSLASILIKKAGTKQIFAFTIWAMLFAPLPLFLMAFFRSGSEHFFYPLLNWNGSLAFSVLFQAYPVTLFGYWIWNRILAKYPLSTVAPLTLLVPIFGLIGGALFYQEEVASIKITAAALIICGLLVSLLAGKPKQTTLAITNQSI